MMKPTLGPLRLPTSDGIQSEAERAKAGTSNRAVFTNKTKLLPTTHSSVAVVGTTNRPSSSPFPKPVLMPLATDLLDRPTTSDKPLPDIPLTTPRTEPIVKSPRLGLPPSGRQNHQQQQRRQPTAPKPPPSSSNSTTTPPPSPPAGSQNPVYSFAQLEIINAKTLTIPPSSFLLPSTCFDLFQSTNKADKRTDNYETMTYILDVRSQSEMAHNVVNGRGFTLVRGAVPFPLDTMINLQSNIKTANKVSLYPEPLNEVGDEVKGKRILLSCTDGKKSVLAWDYMVNELKFTNVAIVSGGIRGWAEAKLPLTIVASGDISSDSDSD